jgi:putative aldouronate transport system permease protein
MSVGKVPLQLVQKVQKQKTIFRFVANLPLTLMALPAVIYFALFHYMPMGGIIIAFKKYS